MARHDLTGKQLDKQLTDWLAKVDKHPNVAELPPVQGCKAVIAPCALSTLESQT